VDKPWLKFYTEENIHAELPKCTIYEYVWRNNKNNLKGVALSYFDKEITYRELFSKIEKAASAFTAIGVKEGDIVIMATVTTPETIYALYALNQLGAIPNMVDPRTSAEGIREYIEEVQSRYVLCLDAAYPKIEEAIEGTTVEKVIVTSPSNSLPGMKKTLYKVFKQKRQKYTAECLMWRGFMKQGVGVAAKKAPYKENSCCIIVHTGGTTGMPKGVMLTNDNMNGFVVQGVNSGFDLQRGHRWLGVMPPFIAYGIGNGMHLPLVLGIKLIIIPAFNPDEYDKLLLKYKPNHIAGVPSHYNSLMKSKLLRKADLSFLISPIVGGDGTQPEFEKQISDFLVAHNCSSTLIKGYGMTEVSAAVCATARREFNKIGSVGIPLSHSMISIFDPDTGKELPIGEEGEICIHSPNTMLGYYNNKEATDDILRRHDDGLLWVHSGDLGHMDEDGCVFIGGRIKRMIIRYDGFKVFPPFIENVIMQSPYVKAVCAVGSPDRSQSQGQLPVAFVVLNDEVEDEGKKIKRSLKKLCNEELPEYAQPIDFLFLPALPLTSIGKVDYRELEKIAASRGKKEKKPAEEPKPQAE
jgi:long-chain acyl-CoA synthetase